jgi:hypothetical protein
MAKCFWICKTKIQKEASARGDKLVGENMVLKLISYATCRNLHDMSHLQGELAKARAELAAARVVMAVAHPGAVIHPINYEDDDDMGFLPNDADVSDAARVVREPLEAAVGYGGGGTPPYTRRRRSLRSRRPCTAAMPIS